MGLENLGALAGAGLGALIAGPGGYAAGAGMGMQLGGMVGGMIDPTKPQLPTINQVKAKTAVQSGPSNAMQRRLEQLDQQPLQQITAGLDSLKYIKDDAVRESLAKPLLQAEFVARKKMGMEA